MVEDRRQINSGNKIETKITGELFNLIYKANISGLRKIEKGNILKNKRFKETIEKWYGRKIPYVVVEPDLILIFEDYNRVVDDSVICAVEIKFFKESRDLNKKLRQAYREFGQPLRNLLFGFDAALLWHIFSEEIDEEKIKNYSQLLEDTIQKLKLPISYIATKFSQKKFKIFQPWDIYYSDVDYIIRSLKGLLENRKNPLLTSGENLEAPPFRRGKKYIARVGFTFKGVLMVTDWILAIATVCYVIGTFLLWYTTRQMVKETRDVTKLYIPLLLTFIYKPTYGMSQNEYDKWCKDIRNVIRGCMEPSLKKVFPEKADEILKLFEG
ncbi:MAG: hypothetical protein HZA07_00535 [Nitrospirae bacterium]|nr:hypothetical protein [Nitrospirota bacterium]